MSVSNSLPNITFFNSDALADMFGYMKWLIKFNFPILAIILAIIVVSLVSDTIIDLFVTARQESDDDRRSSDDDIDVKYY